MCNIIVYGFTVNGTLKSGTSCHAYTSDIIGAQVQVQFDAADVGKTFIARINLRFSYINKGEFNSTQYTVPYAGAMALINIPFTDLITQVGTYTFGYGGAGCAYIYNVDNLGSYVCVSCESTKCTSLTLCTPNWQCETPLNGYEADGCGNRRLNTNCNPLVQKWKCSGSPNYICSQVSDGTYDTEAECTSACKPSIKMWTIKGEKGMTGTVELPAGYGLLWHLVLPNGTKKDLYYGSPTAIPYTYVDSSGRDQIAVVDSEWAYFDQNYTGNIGEVEVPVSGVTTSFPNGTTFTGRISIKPSNNNMLMMVGVGIGIAILYFTTKGK